MSIISLIRRFRSRPLLETAPGLMKESLNLIETQV